MDKAASQLFRSLLDPRIAKFVDWRKFLASSEFQKLAQEQVNHFIKHGDSTLIRSTLDSFRSHRSFKPMLLWFCDSAGLDFYFSGKDLVLKRASTARTKEGDLKNYVAKYSGSARDVGGTVELSGSAGDVGGVVGTTPSRQQMLSKLFNPDGRRGGSPYIQGGAPGLGKRS